MSVDEQADVPPVVRQQQLVQQIARFLVEAVDAPWEVLRYETSSLVGYQEHIVYVRDEAGNTQQKWPADDVSDLVRELRAVMYRPGAGAWFSATMTITRPDRAAADFDYDSEPHWDGHVDPLWYAQDLENYPRDESAIPDWLRQRTVDTSTGR